MSARQYKKIREYLETGSRLHVSGAPPEANRRAAGVDGYAAQEDPARHLMLRIQERVSTRALVALTNIDDAAATTVDERVLRVSCEDVIAWVGGRDAYVRYARDGKLFAGGALDQRLMAKVMVFLLLYAFRPDQAMQWERIAQGGDAFSEVPAVPGAFREPRGGFPLPDIW